ncbi:MAG: diguanylate cyclase (GGDEF)-like protein [Parasphingorhabdus sp.]|jgi:diguanylate cyclase (GGDEF)-like protein
MEYPPSKGEPEQVGQMTTSLDTTALQIAADRAGLKTPDQSTNLSMQQVDKRRFQLWMLTAVVTVLVMISLLMISSELGTSLPTWIPEQMFKIAVFVVVIMLALYTLEKEFQLRKVCKLLFDEQFERSILTRRLNVVDTLLAANKAINENQNPEQVLKTISRQATIFLEENDLSIYILQRGGGTLQLSGDESEFHVRAASLAMDSRQSKYLRGQGQQGRDIFAVPVIMMDKSLGAVVLGTEPGKLDSMETILALSLFSEQCATAIALAHFQEQQEIAETQQIHHDKHDQLTGLLTRHAFMQEVEGIIQNYDGRAPKIAMIFIDLVGIKTVNDQYGYHVGDGVISKFAEHMLSNMPSNAISGRFSGDQYVIAVYDFSSQNYSMKFATKLRARLVEPLVVDAQEIVIDACFGVAIPEIFEVTADELMRDAQLAAQNAKLATSHNVVMFEPSMRTELKEKAELKGAIRQALDNDEIEIIMQPIFDLKEKKIIAAEVLMQWIHPQKGHIAAGSFLSMAMESGHAREIDQRVFQKSCAALRTLRNYGVSIPFHINLFPSYLNSDNVVDGIRNIVETANLEPSDFVLEVTENDKLLTDQKTLDNLAKLKEMGYKIALDDFGTGASGLSYLNRLPVDILKIDKTFTKDLNQGIGSGSNIVSVFINLARNLNLNIIAEGIENDKQLEVLEELGCNQGQGYFLGKPMHLKNFLNKLQSEQTEV